MAHWLEGIAKLLHSESDDLADLARELGYEPTSFYRGTLSPEQIDRLVIKVEPEPNDKSNDRVDGDLGPADAWFPPGFIELSAGAIVFDNEIALQEAYFQGALDKDFVAVLRFPEGPERPPEHLQDPSSLTPVLELVHEKGHRVALLANATVSRLVSPILCVANFVESAARNGKIGTIRDGDTISISARDNTLRLGNGVSILAPQPLAWSKSRFDEVVESDDRDSFIRGLGRFLALQVYVIDSIQQALTKEQTKYRRQIYVRIFDNTCRHIIGCCYRLSSRSRQTVVSAFRSDLHSLTAALRRGSRHLSARGQSAAAMGGYRAALALFYMMDEIGKLPASFEFADTYVAMGDIHLQDKHLEEAIGHYHNALDLLEGLAGRQKRRAVVAEAKALVKIAACHQELDERGHAEHALDNAESRLSELVVKTEGEALMFGALFMQRAVNKEDLGDRVAAAEYCDKALDAYFQRTKTKSSLALAGKLAEAFAYQADLLSTFDNPRAVLMARASAFYLRMKIAERADFVGVATRRLERELRALKLEVKNSEIDSKRSFTADLRQPLRSITDGFEITTDGPEFRFYLSGYQDIHYEFAGILPDHVMAVVENIS